MTSGGVSVSNLYIVIPEGGDSEIGIVIGFVYSDDPITIKNNYIEIQNPSPWGVLIGIDTSAHDVPLYIVDNHFNLVSNDCFVEAIQIGAFGEWYGLGEGPNQHEVVIRGNTVDNTNEGTILAGGRIRLGHSAGGVNNAILEYNIFLGTGLGGIEISPYSSNCIVRYNDLSGWTTSTAQIRVAGSNNIIVDNILGEVNPQDIFGKFGWPFFPTGIEVISLNFHPPSTPSWDTENNVIMRNDFRNTGLPGWSFDDEGDIVTYGCIVLYNYNAILETAPPVYSTSGLSCRNNIVFEVGRFPDGTGGTKQQVWIPDSELVYDNRVFCFTLNNPTNMSTHHSSTIIDFSVTDASGFSQLLYNWDNTLNKTLSAPYEVLLPVDDGQHVLYVYAQDTVGNWVSVTYIFNTDDSLTTTATVTRIPIISVMTGFIVFVILKKKKRTK
ncbi:MAG: hypothetical protein ACXADY_23290 [Candidatus Hodarchaeales archaeon]